MAPWSPHIGAPPGSMHVQPLVPCWIAFILPSAPMLKMVACSRTLGGAAPFKSVMRSWSLIIAICACAAATEARNEVTSKKDNVLFIGSPPPVSLEGQALVPSFYQSKEPSRGRLIHKL